MSLLAFENASVTYDDGRPFYAVRGASFDVQEGCPVGIVGESGSGKSTLMHAALRILNPRVARVSGRILLGGVDILTMDDATLQKTRWKQMAVVFQKSMNALSPVHRVGTFMEDVYRVHEPDATRTQAARRVTELLELVSLPARVRRLYPHELSGGMMQRVSIALSLMHNPRLLILDEATTALDVVTQTQILEEMMALEKKLGLTRVMVTHDMSVVASTCQEVAVLYAGKLVEYGPVATALVSPSHPYTKCMLESFPDLRAPEGAKLLSIPGALPDLHTPPAGCIFAARCPEAMEVCREKEPTTSRLGARHFAACHLIGEGV